MASRATNSSGSSLWNVDTSNPSTTLVVEKINKIEKLIIEGKVTLVDDEGKPLEKVASSCEYDSEDEVASVDNDRGEHGPRTGPDRQRPDRTEDRVGPKCRTEDRTEMSLLEQWTESYENADYGYDPYDDDMYEDQDIPDKLQDICDKLDITVRCRRKK
ncbi:hypothetical protein Tco_0424466 [Tanacetum coccineum]